MLDASYTVRYTWPDTGRSTEHREKYHSMTYSTELLVDFGYSSVIFLLTRA